MIAFCPGVPANGGGFLAVVEVGSEIPPVITVAAVVKVFYTLRIGQEFRIVFIFPAVSLAFAEENGSAFQVVSVIQPVDPVDFRGRGWSRIAIAGKRFPVVVDITDQRLLDLFLVGNTGNSICFFSGIVNDRQQHPGEDGNNGDDDEQFQQGKIPPNREKAWRRFSHLSVDSKSHSCAPFSFYLRSQ